MRVLLSDDSKTIRLILRNLLWELGINEVEEAANGREALELLAKYQFDLILLDIHMPEIEGLDVLEAVKTGEDTRHVDVPVVIISSDTDYRQIERARDLGAYGYIKKPFKKEGLEAAIAAAQQAAPARPAVGTDPDADPCAETMAPGNGGSNGGPSGVSLRAHDSLFNRVVRGLRS